MITIQTITTDIRDALGALASGTVSIRPNAAWSYDDGGGQDKVVPTPKSVTVTAGKVTAFALPPSKNGGVITVNAGYIVTYTLANTPEWTELWILDAAGGSTIEWGAIQVADSSLTQPPALPIAGPAGPQGAAGQSVDHVSLTSGNSAPGTTDTYTIWGDAGETINLGTFLVYNGLNAGGSGVMIAATYDGAGIAEQLVGLTAAQTLTNKTLTAPVINSPTGITPADVNALATSMRETANGVAGLDANSEVIKPQAGAAAQTAAGLGAGYRRADGTWAKTATNLPQDFPLQTWADNLVSGVVYDVNLTVAQNGLPIGWWYIEVIRHLNDIPGNQYRVIRATSFGLGNAANLVYQSTNTYGAWTPFYQFAINAPLNWVVPTFVNGWAQLTFPNSVRYSQDSMGNVTMTGLVNGGSFTTQTTIFTLPVGMRPLRNFVFTCAMGNGNGQLGITTSGVVQFYGADSHTGSAWVSLACTFKGEQ